MSEEEFTDPTKRIRGDVRIRLPTGMMVGLDQLLSQEGQAHVEIDVARMKAGDVVIADYANQSGAANDDRPGRFSVKFAEAQWAHLGIAEEFGPSKSWTVEVSGLPPKKPHVYRGVFGGAGFGGSMRSPGVIATDRSLLFHLPDLGELRSPFVTKLAVVRKDIVDGSEVHRLVKPDELSSGDEHIREIHERRLGQYAELMKKFGFAKEHDFRNGEDQSFLDNWKRRADYEDDTFAATYHAGMAQGNSLIVFNKKDRTYTHYHYYNFKNRDALQVCYSDLEGDGEPFNPHEHGRLYMGESMVHRSGSSIVTYNTSPNISLEAINYKVSKSDASDLLHIPLYGNWEDVTAPDIEIYPDNTFRVPEQYPISLLTKQDPEIFQKIREKVALERDGKATVAALGGEKRRLRTPEEIFSALQVEN